MLDLYTFATSNGQRVAIMLEECGLPYRVHVVDLSRGEQRAPAFLAVHPAGMIPVLVDPDGPSGAPISLVQSGAILLHLAARTGRFLPADPGRRAEAMQWLFASVTDVACASAALYVNAALVPDKSEANQRFLEERLLRHLRAADARLADRETLADEYSVADIALFPVATLRRALIVQAGLVHLVRWLDALSLRPAVQRGLAAGT